MGKKGLYCFRGLASFVSAATVLPLFPGHHWAVRLFDYPRMQIFTLGLLAAAFGCRARRASRRLDRCLLGAVGSALAVQAAQIYPYTPVARKAVLKAKTPHADLRILTCNVLQTNHRTRDLLRLIHQNRPHLVLLTETDQWWLDELSSLERIYPHIVRCPLDNTYGMVLYSLFPLVDPHVRFLVKQEIPSIRAKLHIPERPVINLYCVHPEPPGSLKPNGELRGTGPRDAELVVVAKEIERTGGPTIVIGDFNDVAWSHTTRLFQRIGNLLDPRVGRGFYNTFNARTPLLRYPLDHLFHSDHFALVDFQRLPAIGSDHFPILAALSFSEAARRIQEPQEKKPGDDEEAREIIREAPVD